MTRGGADGGPALLHFVPYRFFTNCQYFFSQNSIVPDVRRSYEYGALSTLAVTPNLCLAEVRPWLDSLSPSDQARILAFYSKWTGFVKEHFDLWRTTHHICDDPGPGAVEIYGHSDGNRGLVFIVNPQYFGRTVRVSLDASLGFTGQGRCEIAELYPTERLRLTDKGPFPRLGATIAVEAAAQEVVVLEVRPAPKGIDEPRLYGLPGSVERTPTVIWPTCAARRDREDGSLPSPREVERASAEPPSAARSPRRTSASRR